MKTRDSKDVVRQEGAPVPSHPRLYVVECDAYELPEFYFRRSELFTCSCNHERITQIFNGEGMHNREWYGGELKEIEGEKGWKAARDLIQSGWPVGADTARKLADTLLAKLPEPESARRKPIWKDEGDDIDRDRLYSGDLDTAWRGTTKVIQRAPRVIKIAAAWGMNCGYTAKQIMWNGVAITALLDVLERSGYGTELVLGFPSILWEMGGRCHALPIVRLKTAGDPLDLSNIAVIAGNAGIFRSFGFAMLASSPVDVGSSFGMPMQIRSAWKAAVEQGVAEPVDAYVEISSSEEQAFDTCVGVLKELFPELTEALDAIKLDATKVRARR